jgi:hypothetical protein
MELNEAIHRIFMVKIISKMFEDHAKWTTNQQMNDAQK